MSVLLPLIEEGIDKQGCLDIIAAAGIKLPAMYGLGYKNNNCLGCVKATLLTAKIRRCIAARMTGLLRRPLGSRPGVGEAEFVAL